VSTLVLGTAGHVDHGKTALVGALTGVDTDRLPEEKARGISIALGFASLTLPSGRSLSLVDVPGHERFVRHMVAGASGIDGYLLCIAADDGVMPQTIEHKAVLDLLGVRDGVVAITKSDLMDPELAVADARELVGDGPEIVPVSIVTGRGLDELAGALDRLAARLERRTAVGPPRLFVDRVFSVVGAGTVVTGTLWGEGLQVGDRVQIVPGGVEARVRGIEVHDDPVTVATGGRTALNLAGIERDDAPRGSCVVRVDDRWRPTERLDVAVDWLADAGGPLRSRRRLQAFLGTAEFSATCVLLDADELSPGDEGYAQLRLERPVVAAAGDRLVLRSAERRTVGGARIVDAAPPRHGKGSGAAERLRAIDRGDPVELLRIRLARVGGDGVPIDGIAPDVLAAAGVTALPGGRGAASADVERSRRVVTAALADGPADASVVLAAMGVAPALGERLLALFEEEGLVERRGNELAPPGARRSDPNADRVFSILEDAALRPPGQAELAERLSLAPDSVAAALTVLRDEGRAVLAGDLWFAASHAARARGEAAAALAAGPMTIGALRDLWGVGRRQALALASHLDATGLTRRVGDERVLRRGAR
jgi:selenocysteine-specific elongation factor